MEVRYSRGVHSTQNTTLMSGKFTNNVYDAHCQSYWPITANTAEMWANNLTTLYRIAGSMNKYAFNAQFVTDARKIIT